jgi:DHA1 family tetracycline resistance protein-like MFS transporter
MPPGFSAIWACVALDLVGFGIVVPILPRYAERFGASPSTVGLLVASFSIAQLVFAPVWGRVSDRIGRKPVLIASLVGTAAGSLLTGLAGTLWLLFAGRIIDGISGASVSVAQAAVADIAEPAQRARLLGLLGAAFGLGFVAGPAIGALAVLGGPHVPFFIAAALAGINAVVAWKRLPETKPHPSELATPSPSERDRGGEFARGKGTSGLLLVTFLGLLAFSAFEATFALFVEGRLDLGESSTYGVFAAIGVAIVLVQVRLVGPTVRRLGERHAVAAGLVANGAGLALLGRVHSWALLAPALGLLTIGQGLITPTLASMVAGRVGSRRLGQGLGFQQAAGGLARVVGPLAGGVAFQHVAPSAPYAAGAVVVLLAFVVLATLPQGESSTLTGPPG